MKHLAFALLTAALLPAAAQAQQAVDEELPPGMAPDEPDHDFLLGEVEEEQTQPHRVFGTLGGGVSLRPVQDLSFQQKRFAPSYLDLFGAFVLGSASQLRHGAGLGVSSNLTGDGGAAEGLDGFEQLVLMPSYLAYYRLGWDLVLTGKAGVGFAVSPKAAMGAELAVGAAYYLTAGFGLYGEIGGSMWIGGDSSVHPLVSGELGVAIDYEVLP